MEAGVDEAGRGPLAGPVVAAAVILPANHSLVLKDSKLLSPKKREALCILIKEIAISYSIVRVEPEIIDRINILQATLLAMKQAIESLSVKPSLVLIDGNQCPKVLVSTRAVVGGDKIIPSISAASILAKVERDSLLDEYAVLYPEYGFEEHKGYPTKRHIEALAQYGITPIHRKTFGPVRRLLEERDYV